MKLYIAGLLLLAGLYGCGPSRYISQLETYTEKKLNLEYNVASVEIIDERLKVDAFPIALPFISFPGQYIRNSPKLDTTHQRIMESRIRENCGGNNPVEVVVHLLNGYKEFSATYWNETEKVYVQLQVDIKDGEQTSASCRSYANYSVTSADAKHKRIEKLYRLALEGALTSCLENLVQQP